MAKVMISLPDDLLAEVDLEAERRRTTRSGLIQKAVRKEIGLGAAGRSEIVTRLEELATHWQGPGDSARLIREDRDRDE